MNAVVASAALLIQEQNFSNLLLGVILSSRNQGLWLLGLHGGKLINQIASAFYYGPFQDSNLVWRPMFDSFVLAVNASPLQLTDEDFYGKPMAMLQKHDVSPQEIELKITESMALSTEPVVTRTVDKLSQSGIKISMDDFGMGFSSILYLQRFDLYAIKLDGTLTRDVTTNCVGADIISAVATLKKTNNIHIVLQYCKTSPHHRGPV